MIGSWDYEHILVCFVIIIPFSIVFFYSLWCVSNMWKICLFLLNIDYCFLFSNKLGVRKEKLTLATFKWLKKISKELRTHMFYLYPHNHLFNVLLTAACFNVWKMCNLQKTWIMLFVQPQIGCTKRKTYLGYV